MNFDFSEKLLMCYLSQIFVFCPFPSNLGVVVILYMGKPEDNIFTEKVSDTLHRLIGIKTLSTNGNLTAAVAEGKLM